MQQGEQRFEDVSASSDIELVTRTHYGDREAFAELYQRHAGAVYARARRVSSDSHVADDVLQEVLLRLWERPDRYDAGRGSLRTYLLIDTDGRSMDVMRAQSRRTDREDHAARLVPSDLATDIEDILVAQQMRDAFEVLTSQERTAIELAYFGDRSYRQVAALLAEPEGTIKSRIRSGLTKLRGHLIREGGEEP